MPWRKFSGLFHQRLCSLASQPNQRILLGFAPACTARRTNLFYSIAFSCNDPANERFVSCTHQPHGYRLDCSANPAPIGCLLSAAFAARCASLLPASACAVSRHGNLLPPDRGLSRGDLHSSAVWKALGNQRERQWPTPARLGPLASVMRGSCSPRRPRLSSTTGGLCSRFCRCGGGPGRSLLSSESGCLRDPSCAAWPIHVTTRNAVAHQVFRTTFWAATSACRRRCHLYAAVNSLAGMHLSPPFARRKQLPVQRMLDFDFLCGESGEGLLPRL